MANTSQSQTPSPSSSSPHSLSGTENGLNPNGIRVGVVGATGVVGETFLNILDERDFPVKELRLFASENSQGQTRKLGDHPFPIQTLKPGCFDGLELVFFSSGDDISREWAPKAVAAGAFAIDNSGAFRMDSEVALVVPEINADLLPKRGGKPTIIANPNCSTIQLVVALQPLLKTFGLQSVRIASYQSVSGAGRAGLEELFAHTKNALEGEANDTSDVFSKSVAFDSVPQIGGFREDGFCTEEVKIMNETRKILRQEKLKVSAFTVRVPTINSHAEAVWVTLAKPAQSLAHVETALGNAEGIELVKSSGEVITGPRARESSTAKAGRMSSIKPAFPTQAMASGQDPVFVGRVHKDLNDDVTWMMWVVSDNLRKGAALNGCQIAERIFDIDLGT